MDPVSAAASREAVERAVEEVLADPAFQKGLAAQGTSYEEVIYALLASVLRFFSKLIDSLVELREASPFLFWTIFVGGCLVLAALLLHIGWTVSLAFRKVPGPEIEAPPAHGEARRRHSLAILEEARRLAAAGQGREALRTLLLALLARVEERRILRIAAGWTHREIAGRLRVPAELRPELLTLEGSVEAAWYGSAAVTQEHFGRCEAAARRLIESFHGRSATTGRDFVPTDIESAGARP